VPIRALHDRNLREIDAAEMEELNEPLKLYTKHERATN